MRKADDYIELKCGIQIPIIVLIDKEKNALSVVPVEAKKLLSNDDGETFTEEGAPLDELIFFYADTFEKSPKMIKEIVDATGIKGLKFNDLD